MLNLSFVSESHWTRSFEREGALASVAKLFSFFLLICAAFSLDAKEENLINPTKSTSTITPITKAITAAAIALPEQLLSQSKPQLHVSSPTYSFVGKAYSLDSNQLLYTEFHDMRLDDRGNYVSADVRYFDPQEVLIAEKSLLFGHDLLQPELDFRDLRTNVRYTTSNVVKPSGPGTLVTADYENEREENLIPSSSLAVTDAGFNQLVQQNWQTLVSGETITFEFLALTRAKYFEFDLTRVEKDLPDVAPSTGSNMILSLAPASFFLSLLVDPIYLTYDLDSKRLLRFEGITNIEAFADGVAQGNNYVARIEYSYF